MIGGILFFILMYIFARHYYSMWSLGGSFVYGFLFYLFINGGAIVGALLGFINKSWQIGKNWQIESLEVGRIMCFLVGFFYPFIHLLLSFSESFLDYFYINIPMLLLLIGGITSIIEWQLELRKNKFAQK